jgi:putative ABC transport system ATP-binding protein
VATLPHTAPPTAAVTPDGARTPRSLIEMREVAKVYGTRDTEVRALSGVTLTIARGDYVAIMGASGSGKSTLMNILGCLDVPTTGRYRLVGVDVADLADDELSDIRNRLLGFVFQSFNLIPRTSALMNVELPLVYQGLRRAERRDRAQAVLEAVGLADRMEHLPSELSGGQQQRVALARAMVTNPAVILADEPTGALDTVSSAEILRMFDAVNAQRRTVVVITHEPEVAAHAKRVIRLRDGRIVADERVAEVRDLPPRFHPTEPPVAS